MLDLHRASAGSGKTYALARKYIWFLITISQEGEPRRLRTDAELADSARHILAVTFTNKATNEMQQRIVDKLFSLGNSPVEYGRDAQGNPQISKPDYMREFAGTLGVDPKRVAAVCRKALSLLLENYSDFKVSTIDSFFQLVLRTFAYESDLNDAYQVELDSEFLSQVGVDGTLEEIDANEGDRATPYWIRRLMERGEKRWNIFSREKSTMPGVSNPYTEFVKSVQRLDNEEYKLIRDEMEDYFSSSPDFISLYEGLACKYEKPVKEAFREMRDICSDILSFLPGELQGVGSRTVLGQLISRLRRFAKPGEKDWRSDPDKKLKVEQYFVSGYGEDSAAFRKILAPYGGLAGKLSEAMARLQSAFETWTAARTSPDFCHWMLYSANIPYLALFSIASRKRQEYLDEANAVELGETSMILHGVIGDSDAPFIYERLGSTLNHFLVDEFQDTSRLQWENLRPLLTESLSRDNGNLIIGDAKQSIYRFRNADPSLITSVVPEQFGAMVNPIGNRPEENTNFRSSQRIVQFNNSFFEYLVRCLDSTASAEDGRRLFGPLYANVVQTPNKSESAGYVEIALPGPTQGKRRKDAPERQGFNEWMLERVPRLVASLVARGYRQKDIAVLVSRHSEAESMIASFIDYNSGLGPDDSPISFVSEQSLKLANSPSVKIIVGVLQNLAKGFRPQINEGDERLKKGVGNWADIESSFKFFAMGREGMSRAELLDAYLNERPGLDNIGNVLSRLQSMALPALVEASVAAFVPEQARRRDAVFIAAFQDLLLEYCDGHPTDVASFLKWWERKSESASISSPEETDAVRVMTVHKSKGLEFDCVIIPFANWDMADAAGSSKTEWRWVKPERISHPDQDMKLPPYIPVETSALMQSTTHRTLLDDFHDMVKMDRLNSAYVAFTRASRELYVFANDPDALSGGDAAVDSGTVAGRFKTGRYLADFFNLVTGSEFNADRSDRTRVCASDFNVAEGETPDHPVILTVGTPGVPPGQTSDEPDGDIIRFDDYRSILPEADELRYRQADLPAVVEAQDIEDDIAPAELDPRSEGNIKHAVLQYVRTAVDLPAAVRHVCASGLLDPHMAEGIRAELTEALANPEVAPWFDGKARVIAERPILMKGRVTRRPDRILVFPDKHAVVVDYKFGKHDDSGKYRRQIGRYVALLAKTGLFKSVEGYIWYVNEHIIEKV